MRMSKKRAAYRRRMRNASKVRTAGPGRYLRPQPSQMITVKKTRLFEDFLTTNLLSPVTSCVTFEPIYIGDWNTLTAVYDQYRIESVKFTLIPKFNANGNTVPGNTGQPPFTGIVATAIDYDSDTATSTIQEVLNYPSAKWTRGTAIHTRKFTPKPLLQSAFVPASGTADVVIASNSGTKNPWIDCTKGQVKHAGIRLAIEDSDNNPFVYDCIVEWIISLKNLH